jgi:hypothetical protein
MASQLVNETQNTQTNTISKKLITGYIRYNKDENIENVINTLKSFHAKYSHHIGYIFFSLDQNKLSELSTLLKFRISRFESKSHYSCSPDLASSLTSQRDSFLRIHYVDASQSVEFLSRTTSSVHYNLVQRLFKRANIEFVHSNYSSNKISPHRPFRRHPPSFSPDNSQPQPQPQLTTTGDDNHETTATPFRKAYRGRGQGKVHKKNNVDNTTD